MYNAKAENKNKNKNIEEDADESDIIAENYEDAKDTE